MFGELNYVAVENPMMFDDEIKSNRYIKYSKAIIRIKEDDRVTKLNVSIPIKTDSIRELDQADNIAKHLIHLYSILLDPEVQILELSLKLSGNRIALYGIENNNKVFLKSITFKTKNVIDKS